jgi:hypothetical protein
VATKLAWFDSAGKPSSAFMVSSWPSTPTSGVCWGMVMRAAQTVPANVGSGSGVPWTGGGGGPGSGSM